MPAEVKEIGGGYLRYSCDNSNPRSLDQQLRNALERARQDGVLIPWEYVFADAAVTGTTAARRGYQMAKGAIEAGSLRRLYIDEIGRAARDAIEALNLGRLIERCCKRLIGVSDGFDSEMPHSKLMLAMFAMLHEWFVDQLRSKVKRGMNDAFAQGRNIWPPSIGYKLVPATDPEGHPIYDQEGAPVRAKVIDKGEAERVEEAFRLFVEKCWSPERIARRFNERKVGGKQTWDRRRIVQLLTRDAYVGVEYYGKTYQQRDPETGKVTVKHRPPEEWKRRNMPHLRIVSDELWQKAQARLKECSEAFAPALKKRQANRRTAVYPKTLFRPVCGCCGTELVLGRSGKYASFCCLNGRDGKQGCALRTYKSVRLVETSILDHVREHVFTADFLKGVLEEANCSLAKEARRPREDSRPVVDEIKALKAKHRRLVKVLHRYGNKDLDAVVQQVRRLERRTKDLRRQLKETRSRNASPPPPLRMADAEALLDDLHELLNEDVALAAPVLAKLTGPIEVRQADQLGNKGTHWTAAFTINMVPVLAKLAARRACPTAGTWEYLNTRGWTKPRRVNVELRHTPSYERMAAKVQDAVAEGVSINSLAQGMVANWSTVQAALNFAATGRRPKPKP